MITVQWKEPLSWGQLEPVLICAYRITRLPSTDSSSNEMVYAFLIHSLAPGPCRVLYSLVFVHDPLVSSLLALLEPSDF